MVNLRRANVVELAVTWFAEIVAAVFVVMVALHLEAQELGRDKHWLLKPKLHMLQESLEFDCMMHGQSPRLFWTYKDESWGGLVASMAERRGGAKSAAAIGLLVMQRYRAWVNE